MASLMEVNFTRVHIKPPTAQTQQELYTNSESDIPRGIPRLQAPQQTTHNQLELALL